MTFGVVSFLASVVVTLELFWLSKLTVPAGDTLRVLSQVSGLLGLLFLSWSYLLAVRHPLLERAFGGLDRVYRWHHIAGGTAFVLLMNHPVFLMISALPTNTFMTYFVPGSIFSYTLGILAFYCLLVLLSLTLFVDLPYKIWKRTHEWLGLVIILGAWHALIVPSDVSRFVPLSLWVGVVSAAAIAAFLYKRFLYYILDRGVSCRVSRVTWENDTVLLTMTSDGKRRIPQFRPGQFAFLSFTGKGEGRDEHPFSVVSQDDTAISFGMKVIGGFTLKLSKSQPGATVRIRGPYGMFSIHKPNIGHMLWVAGGIGITPFMYLLRAVSEHQHLTFITTARGSIPKIFREPVERLIAGFPSVTFIHHDSSKDGRLTAGKIVSMAPVFRDTHVWLCGPKSLMTTLSEQLPAYGVLRHRIYFEDFSLK